MALAASVPMLTNSISTTFSTVSSTLTPQFVVIGHGPAVTPDLSLAS